MTVDEHIAKQKFLEQKLLRANNFTAQVATAGMADCIHQISSFYGSIAQTINYEGLSSALLIFSQTQMQLTSMMQESIFPPLMSGVEDSLRSLASTTQALSSSMISAMSIDAQSYAYEAIARSLRTVLVSVSPYVHDEQIDKLEQLEQTAQPILETRGKKHLSLSDLLTIINLLFTLYFGILSSIPDERIDRIITQNETIINQNAEIIALGKEDEALRDVLYDLTDSINLLTDEVELLREELESTKDEPASERQDNTEDDQQQDGNAQD